MKEILQFIDSKKQNFAKLPLFEFMQDRSISPRQRLSFAPCMAHYVMSFSDLNKYVLRDDTNDSLIQKIVNEHTYEDDEHWPWYITDIKKLGLNRNWDFNQSLQFIWGENTKITRQIAYTIAGYSLNADPCVKISIIEALEAMGHVFCSVSAQLALDMQNESHEEYEYFGHLHLDAETGHAMGTPGAESFLESVELTPTQREQALEAVDKIFQVFSEWTYELLAYAQAQDPDQTNSKQSDLLTACS